MRTATKQVKDSAPPTNPAGTPSSTNSSTERGGSRVLDPYTIAEQVAPKLGELVHPGDDNTPPFPLSLPTFQPAILPEGMAQAEAEELGLPSLDLNKLFLEALFALLSRDYNVTLVNTRELAEIQAAAEQQTLKPNQAVELHLHNQKIARLTVQGYDFTKLDITPDQLQALAVIAQKKAG